MSSPIGDADQQSVLVCLTSSRSLRAQVARLVNGRGVLLMFPDLQSVGSVLFRDRAAVETTSPTAGVVALGRLVVDPDRQQVSWGGQVLPLTRLEREVLAALASPPLRVWTYRNLYERAWGAGYLDDASAVRSTVKRLRGKLRTAGATIAVESVRGVGFSLVDTSVSAHLAPSA